MALFSRPRWALIALLFVVILVVSFGQLLYIGRQGPGDDIVALKTELVQLKLQNKELEDYKNDYKVLLAKTKELETIIDLESTDSGNEENSAQLSKLKGENAQLLLQIHELQQKLEAEPPSDVNPSEAENALQLVQPSHDTLGTSMGW